MLSHTEKSGLEKPCQIGGEEMPELGGKAAFLSFGAASGFK